MVFQLRHKDQNTGADICFSRSKSVEDEDRGFQKCSRRMQVNRTARTGSCVGIVGTRVVNVVMAGVVL
jgi:hypothetical protein